MPRKRKEFHKPIARKITEVDGIKFASKHEATVWGELKLLERAGKVANIQRQVRFPIVVNGHEVCVYVADFVYTDLERPERSERRVVLDAKQFMTPVYRIKRNLMRAVWGIEIQER